MHSSSTLSVLSLAAHCHDTPPLRSRRRLILGEEEPLPDIPEPQRAPYVSPTLAQVTAAEAMPQVTVTESDTARATAGSSVLREPPQKQPLAGLDPVGTAVGATSKSSVDEDGSPSVEDIMAQVRPSPHAIHLAACIHSSLACAQVARLEEQGMLVEASTLMAKALGSGSSRGAPGPARPR